MEGDDAGNHDAAEGDQEDDQEQPSDSNQSHAITAES
jgi:hypothetical protein